MRCSRIITLLLLLLVAVACQDQGQDLFFETIAQNDIINYQEESPALFVVAENDAVSALTLTLLAEDSNLADELRQLDYDRFYAVLVLQGQKSQGGHRVTVQRIVRLENRVSVYAEFTNPEPETRRTQAFTSPYHLVSVSNQGVWGQQIDFVLVAGSEDVAETSCFVP